MDCTRLTGAKAVCCRHAESVVGIWRKVRNNVFDFVRWFYLYFLPFSPRSLLVLEG